MLLNLYISQMVLCMHILPNKSKMGISSTMTRPMREDRRRTRCSNIPPQKEENSKREGSTILNIEVLMKEAFENLKAQVEAEEKLQKEQKMKEMMIEEEETSRRMRVNEMAKMKAQDQYHNGTTREDVEQETFSSCKETMMKNETNESRTTNAKCFRTRIVSETSSDEGASLSKACMIKRDKESEAHINKEAATKNDIKEVAMNNMAKLIDQRRMESSTLVLETWVVASEN